MWAAASNWISQNNTSTDVIHPPEAIRIGTYLVTILMKTSSDATPNSFVVAIIATPKFQVRGSTSDLWCKVKTERSSLSDDEWIQRSTRMLKKAVPYEKTS
jgi:hypothetical protein